MRAGRRPFPGRVGIDSRPGVHTRAPLDVTPVYQLERPPQPPQLCAAVSSQHPQRTSYAELHRAQALNQLLQLSVPLHERLVGVHLERCSQASNHKLVVRPPHPPGSARRTHPQGSSASWRSPTTLQPQPTGQRGCFRMGGMICITEVWGAGSLTSSNSGRLHFLMLRSLARLSRPPFLVRAHRPLKHGACAIPRRGAAPRN